MGFFDKLQKKALKVDDQQLLLEAMTGNIGFHHIHHLSPRIPNYLLQACHEENPMFQHVVALTLWSSFKTVFLSLWDEEQERLISFSQLKSIVLPLEEELPNG